MQGWLSTLGLLLILLGFALAFIAALLLMYSAVKGRGEVRGGGVLLVGPFPIVFGTDKESVKVVLILTILLIAFVLAIMILMQCTPPFRGG